MSQLHYFETKCLKLDASWAKPCRYIAICVHCTAERKFSQPQAYIHHFLHLCLLSVNGLIAHGACFVVQQLTRALSTNWSKSYSGLSDGLHGYKPLFLQFYWQQTRVCAGPWWNGKVEQPRKMRQDSPLSFVNGFEENFHHFTIL